MKVKSVKTMNRKHWTQVEHRILQIVIIIVTSWSEVGIREICTHTFSLSLSHIHTHTLATASSSRGLGSQACSVSRCSVCTTCEHNAVIVASVPFPLPMLGMSQPQSCPRCIHFPIMRQVASTDGSVARVTPCTPWAS